MWSLTENSFLSVAVSWTVFLIIFFFHVTICLGQKQKWKWILIVDDEIKLRMILILFILNHLLNLTKIAQYGFSCSVLQIRNFHISGSGKNFYVSFLSSGSGPKLTPTVDPDAQNPRSETLLTGGFWRSFPQSGWYDWISVRKNGLANFSTQQHHLSVQVLPNKFTLSFYLLI